MERESLTKMVNEWKRGVEGKWSSVQEEWSVEKGRLRRARDEWDLKTETLEDGTATWIESRLSIAQQCDGHPFMNGSARPNGQRRHPSILTPTTKNQLRRPTMAVRLQGCGHDLLERRTSQATQREGHTDNTEASWLTSVKARAAIQHPITPESSLVCSKEEPPRLDSTVIGPDGLLKDLVSGMPSHVHGQELNWNLQLAAHCTTTLGVVALSVVAAAVLWPVKPE